MFNTYNINTHFCTSYCFAHLIVLHFLYCTFYSYFSFFTIYMLLCCVFIYCMCFYIILIFYSSALSTERTWFDYISLLVIPCIIYYVTNKETLNLEQALAHLSILDVTLEEHTIQITVDSMCLGVLTTYILNILHTKPSQVMLSFIVIPHMGIQWNEISCLTGPHSALLVK